MLTPTEKLAKALEALKDPRVELMIANAKRGLYHDFHSHLGFPVTQLVNDLDILGYHDLANKARSGEFDATKEEADAWAATDEGREVIKGRIKTD